MTTHVLKSWEPFFKAFVSGAKKHDLRDDTDRNFDVGDELVLQEYLPFEGRYTGREFRMRVTYITGRETPCAFSSSVLQRGYVILSLAPLEFSPKFSPDRPA